MTLHAFSDVSLLCLWPSEPLLRQGIILRCVGSISDRHTGSTSPLLMSFPCVSGLLSKGVLGDCCGDGCTLVNSRRLTGLNVSSTIQRA